MQKQRQKPGQQAEEEANNRRQLCVRVRVLFVGYDG